MTQQGRTLNLTRMDLEKLINKVSDQLQEIGDKLQKLTPLGVELANKIEDMDDQINDFHDDARQSF
jgi:DNA anti-recombination protein RmuC